MRLLPEEALTALGHWWAKNKQTYPDGTPRAHAVAYAPARWASITLWPAGLAPTSQAGDAQVSRAEVVAMVTDALRREAFREALVATYVGGKGKSGTPGGSGPWTLQKIPAAGTLLDAVLAASVTALCEQGAVGAYTVFHKAVPQFGPSFFTKFLYFAGQALPTVPGLQPLILDRVLSLRLRPLAAAVGRESGLDPDGTVAAWVWAEWDWTPHRYSVYLPYSHQPTRQRERVMKGFRSVGAAQRFLSAFSGISPHFRPRRHLMTASECRAKMTIRFAVWDQVTGVAGQPAAA